MAAVVGEIHDLGAIGADRWCLGLSRLSRDPNRVARVLGRRSADGKPPHVRLTPNPTDEQLARLVYVRFDVGQIAERHLPIATAVAPDDSHVEDRGIQDGASPRRAVHEAGAIGQPGESPQPLAARDFPRSPPLTWTIRARVKSFPIQALKGNRTIIGRPTGRSIDVAGDKDVTRSLREPFRAITTSSTDSPED